MNKPLALYAAGRLFDHPLTEAARVALKANPRPRIIKIIVGLDGKPIEKPPQKIVK